MLILILDSKIFGTGKKKKPAIHMVQTTYGPDRCKNTDFNFTRGHHHHRIGTT